MPPCAEYLGTLMLHGSFLPKDRYTCIWECYPLFELERGVDSYTGTVQRLRYLLACRLDM